EGKWSASEARTGGGGPGMFRELSFPRARRARRVCGVRFCGYTAL
ncbi:MAG: hypothetical protein AVDCRST_MAG14-2618, partial [uncultured Rubrobacteraceae bacterium]